MTLLRNISTLEDKPLLVKGAKDFISIFTNQQFSLLKFFVIFPQYLEVFYCEFWRIDGVTRSHAVNWTPSNMLNF
jgi:hypothetical protein